MKLPDTWKDAAWLLLIVATVTAAFLYALTLLMQWAYALDK